MLRDEILNHMDVDELRNYAHLQTNIILEYENLVYTNDDIASKWAELYFAQEHKAESLNALNVRNGKIAVFTHAMEDKYKQYLPVPTCPAEGGFA